MQTLAERELIVKIQNGDVFTAQVDTGAFLVKINRYVPVICTAIHDGHRVQAECAGKMLVSDAERKYEEDPYTGDLITPFPLTLQVVDSRYNYDVNRDPQNCIYDDAWGKKVWKKEPGEADRQHLLELHASYYRVLQAVIDKVNQLFSCCVLYDLHSYNYSRLDNNPPLFNIGTHYIDMTRFGLVVDHLQARLAAINLQGIENRTVCDEIFMGKGYQAAFMKANHPQSLCVPLEIKKIFMDEQRFNRIPEVYDSLAAGFGEAIRKNAEFFMQHFVPHYEKDSISIRDQ